jgi:hypothetical protein
MSEALHLTDDMDSGCPEAFTADEDFGIRELHALGWSPFLKPKGGVNIDPVEIARIDHLSSDDKILAIANYCLRVGDPTLASVETAARRLEEASVLSIVEDDPDVTQAVKNQNIANLVQVELLRALEMLQQDPSLEFSARQATLGQTATSNAALRALKRMVDAKDVRLGIAPLLGRPSETLLRILMTNSQRVKLSDTGEPL